MALLRSCGRFVQTFVKLTGPWQAGNIQRFERLTRIQGYVTVSPKLTNCTMKNEKLIVPNTDANIIDNVTPLNGTNELQRGLAMLDLGVKNGKIPRSVLYKIVRMYEDGGHQIEDSTALTLLSCCGYKLRHVRSADRQILTRRLWLLICHLTPKLTVKHYNALIIINNQNDEAMEPEKFIADMVVEPDDRTYRLLLNASARRGDLKSTEYILSRMKDAGFPLNAEVFNSIILAYVTNKDEDAAFSVLETMQSLEIKPSAETYASLACGYASAGDYDNTIKNVCVHPLNASELIEIVKRLSRSNLGKHIPDVLKYLPSSVSPSEFISTLTDMIWEERTNDAFTVINCLASVVSTDELHFLYNDFLKTSIRAKIPNDEVMKFMNIIMTSKSYPMAIMDVCEGALRWGDRESAIAIFEAMHDRKIPVRPHYYWPLLIKARRNNSETDVYQIIKDMLNLNVVPDHETFLRYILPYLNTTDAAVTLRKLTNLGLDIYVALTPLICRLLIEARINESVALCSKTKVALDFDYVLRCLVHAYKITRDVDGCAKMLQFAPLKKRYPEDFLLEIFGPNPNGFDVDSLKQFLKIFKDCGISVSNVRTGKLQNNGTNGKDDFVLHSPLENMSTSSRIPHPESMTLEQLECHLIELKSKKMNLRGVLRKLLLLNCRRNNIDRVEEIRKEYEECDYKWTPGLYSNLLEIYTKHGRVDEAMNFYRKLLDHDDFKVDDFKVIDLSTALVRANRTSDAFTLIESTISEGGSRISKNCWWLLNAIAHSSNSELTESMLETLVRSGYCERNNALLGPLVRVDLLRNDVVSAVDTFSRCADRYGVTPLRRELVWVLVKSMGTKDESTTSVTKELLEKVQDITTRIYGKDQTVMDELVALARCQQTDQLHKFLQKNPVRASKLISSLPMVNKAEKVTILTTVLDASTDISITDRNLIYEELLAVYSSLGECEKAKELWKQILALGELPSQTFRQNFVALLQNHNVPLPEGLSDANNKLFESRFGK